MVQGSVCLTMMFCTTSGPGRQETHYQMQLLYPGPSSCLHPWCLHLSGTCGLWLIIPKDKKQSQVTDWFLNIVIGHSLIVFTHFSVSDDFQARTSDQSHFVRHPFKGFALEARDAEDLNWFFHPDVLSRITTSDLWRYVGNQQWVP